MVTIIILALAILTAALIASVFIMALNELDEIDELSGGSRRRNSEALLAQMPASAAETG